MTKDIGSGGRPLVAPERPPVSRAAALSAFHKMRHDFVKAFLELHGIHPEESDIGNAQWQMWQLFHSEIDDLRAAVESLLPFVATEVAYCNGHKCREPWCASCNGEDDAKACILVARSTAETVRKALAAPKIPSHAIKKPNAIEMGDIHVVENPYSDEELVINKVEYAMLLKFDSPESIRQAMQDGVIKFTVFGGDK